MIDTKKFCLQTVGDSLYVGGSKPDIEYLNYSIYNFNGTNTFLTDLSDNFSFFVCTVDGYIRARTRNLWYNYKYNNPDGGINARYRRTKMAYRICELAAKKELTEFKREDFVKPNRHNNSFYSFGNFESDLDKINSDSLAAKETMEISSNDVVTV